MMTSEELLRLGEETNEMDFAKTSKFTDNDIIKGLECCYTTGVDCKDCPFDTFEDCNDVLMAEYVLDLINRQKAEIGRLKEGINFERERVDNIPNLLLQAKSETIKEYIERVSIKLADNARSDYWHWIDDTLHEVEREMAGDTNGLD